MPSNFLTFKAEQLRKVNSQRRAMSQPTDRSVPTLTKTEVMYISEGQMQGEPATCYNCPLYNYGRSCQLLGSGTIVRKFVYPPSVTSDAKPIEYWPCCGEWTRGSPNYGVERFVGDISTPSAVGLGWINSPKIGQEIGGANCGGKNGGDDCDHYCTKGDDKRVEPMAFCRVVQEPVECGGVCAAWRDDDWLSFDLAQNILRKQHVG